MEAYFPKRYFTPALQSGNLYLLIPTVGNVRNISTRPYLIEAVNAQPYALYHRFRGVWKLVFDYGVTYIHLFPIAQRDDMII